MRAVLWWAAALLPALAAAQTSLRFKDDRTLRIVQLTDLHVGEGPADADTLHVRPVSALVCLEAPLDVEALPRAGCAEQGCSESLPPTQYSACCGPVCYCPACHC